MTESTSDQQQGVVDTPRGRAVVTQSLPEPVAESSVQLRLSPGGGGRTRSVDRFEYFTTASVEGPDGPVDVESTHYVTREPSAVAAGDVDRVIESAAGVGVIIEKVEA